MVTNRSIGPAGRRVRCDNCQHEWFETPPIDPADSAPATEPRQTPAPMLAPLSAPLSAKDSYPRDDYAPAEFGDSRLKGDQNYDTNVGNIFKEPSFDSNSDSYNFDSFTEPTTPGGSGRNEPKFEIESASFSKSNGDDPYNFAAPAGQPPEPGFADFGNRREPEDSLNDFPAEPPFESMLEPNKPSPVKKMMAKLSIAKSDTELEFESMIKDLDSEMSDLNNLPDIDSLSHFNHATNRQQKSGSKNKIKLAKRQKPKTGNWTVTAIVIGSLILILAVTIYGRGLIVDLVPRLGLVYRLAGIELPVHNLGLDFQEIHYDKSPGGQAMVIRGKVVNLSNVVKTIPNLQALAHDGGGGVLKRWVLKPEAPIMMPGDQAEFSTPIDNIPPNTNEITLNFTTP